MVRWVTRVYIDGKFARWSDSEHNTEVMRDGTTRDTWSCAEDAWRDIWGWRKINRAGAAPGNERSRTTYRLVRLTRKPRAESVEPGGSSWRTPYVGHWAACPLAAKPECTCSFDERMRAGGYGAQHRHADDCPLAARGT